jgi:hypothetical protein
MARGLSVSLTSIGKSKRAQPNPEHPAEAICESLPHERMSGSNNKHLRLPD